MFFTPSRLLPKTTALRMALIYATFTGLFMVVAFIVTLHRVNRYFFNDLAHELCHEAVDLGVMLEDPDTPPAFHFKFLDSLSSLWQKDALGVLVRTAKGETVYASQEPIAPDLEEGLTYVPYNSLRTSDVKTIRAGGHKHRSQVLAFSVSASDGKEYHCLFTLYPRFIIKSITNIKYNLLWILLSSFVIFSVLGFALAKRAYKPVEIMIRRANEITASNLSLRLDGPKTGQELDRLADAFNRLFDRVEKAFKREKEFNEQVAHELRTPLTASRGQLEMILLDASLSHEHREALASALESLDRLTYLINRMLFLSKAEAGHALEPAKEPFGLHLLVQEVCELVFSEEEERTARITVEIPETLELTADRHMIFRLLLNLVENAKKHTLDGTPIAIRAIPGDKTVTIEVKDEGKGIPENKREKVFEKFYSHRARTADRKTNGAGLGLSIARSIAMLHGGDLTCRETPGGGCTFVCVLCQVGIKEI